MTSASPYAATAVRYGTRQYVEACSWCHRVHDEQGGWGGSESDVSGEDITHGICPDCIHEHFPYLEQAA